MFDYFAKKLVGDGDENRNAKAMSGSLLDVIVPFTPHRDEKDAHAGADYSNKSLLSQIDDYTQKREKNEAAQKEVDRAELGAKKAEFQRSEQLARMEVERLASQRFEDKANKLAQEIERVRHSKFHEQEVSRPIAGGVNVPHADIARRQQAKLHEEKAQFESFQQWQQTANRTQYQPVPPSPPQNAYSSEPQNNVPYGQFYRAPHELPTENYSDPVVQNNSPYTANSPYAANHHAAPHSSGMTSQGGGLYGQNRPSAPVAFGGGLDLDKVFASILGSWKVIGASALIGAVLAGIYSKTLPDKYQAWAELLIDPQGITLIDKQLSTTGYGGEAMIAYLESQLRIIESTSVLNVVIDRESLFNDTEFSEKGASGSGFFNIFGSGRYSGSPGRDRQIVLDNLQDKLTITRGSRTFIVSIGMTTESANKSARIANAIARAYVSGESGARSKIARDASEDLSVKLETLRNRVQTAERKVANFKSENGLVTSDGKLISEVQLSRINEQMAIARIETVNARTRMEQLRSIDLAGVVSGALPASLNTGTLSQLRVRYAGLKSTADRISAKLGPKHPERIAASAELESARAQISKEIERSIAGSKQDYERAQKRQKGLGEQLNAVKAAAVGTGNSLITLRELERELAAHKRVYEDYLLRSRETSEQEGLTTTNARVITKATPPLQKDSPNRKVIAGIGLIIGGLVGLMFALFNSMFAGRQPFSLGVLRNRRPLHGNYNPAQSGLYQQDAQYSGAPYDPGYSRPQPAQPVYKPRY